jgi:translation initiation factor 2 beta subunit (eIF-2beta)/eIF-5
MAKKININGDLTDPFYRYKMPEVIVRQQGAFYAFLNIDDICSEKGGINRPLSDIQKFLTKNLHTSFTYKNKSLITSAPITKDSIQNMIFQYINKFILCTKCQSPETIVSNDKKSYNKCRACGNSDEITPNGVIKPIKKKENKIKDVQEVVNDHSKIVNEHHTIINEHNTIINDHNTIVNDDNKIISNNDLDKKDDKIISNNDLDKKIIVPKEIDQELEDMIDNI